MASFWATKTRAVSEDDGNGKPTTSKESGTSKGSTPPAQKSGEFKGWDFLTKTIKAQDIVAPKTSPSIASDFTPKTSELGGPHQKGTDEGTSVEPKIFGGKSNILPTNTKPTGLSKQGRYLPHSANDPAFQHINITEMQHISESNLHNPMSSKFLLAIKAPGTVLAQEIRRDTIHARRLSNMMAYQPSDVSNLAKQSFDVMSTHSIGKLSLTPSASGLAHSGKKESRAMSKAAKTLPLQKLTIVEEENMKKLLEAIDDRVLAEVPLPMKVTMYEDLNEILHKTAKCYQRYVGRNHPLTKQAVEKAKSVSRWTDVLKSL